MVAWLPQTRRLSQMKSRGRALEFHTPEMGALSESPGMRPFRVDECDTLRRMIPRFRIYYRKAKTVSGTA